jgi:hypothetical protein
MFDLTNVMAFFNDFGNILWSFLQFGLNGIVLIVGGVLYTLEDGILTVVYGFFSALDLSAFVVGSIGSWANVPDIYIYLVNCFGIPQCMTLLGGAIGLRSVLNLIPSWATRV